MKYLYAAYAATWLIHLGYLIIVSRGFKKLRDEVRERGLLR
jgi:CcmD family protein